MSALGAGVLPEIVIHADAAGAAYLMKAVLALGEDAFLAEENGRWRVVVRPSSSPPEPVLARVVDCVASCANDRRLEYATLTFGTRSYAVHPPDPPPPAAAVAVSTA